MLKETTVVQNNVSNEAKNIASAALSVVKDTAAAAASNRGENEKKPKLSVLDKTKKDWGEFKEENNGMEEELDAYKKSSNQYMDKACVSCERSLHTLRPPLTYTFIDVLRVYLLSNIVLDPQLIVKTRNTCLTPIGRDKVKNSKKRWEKIIKLYVVANPSQLEVVDLVVAEKIKAQQCYFSDVDTIKNMVISDHENDYFVGQVSFLHREFERERDARLALRLGGDRKCGRTLESVHP
ncbi:hypothetical protein V6N13_065304 [Hibiscus sabdariffa]